MLPETHPLIKAVTDPLAANAEGRLAAQAFLEEKFDAAHPGIADTTARIEAAGKRKWGALRKVLPWVLAVFVLAAAVTPWVRTIRMISPIYDPFSLSPGMEISPPLPTGLTEEQRLLLGDPDSDDLDQKRRLHLLVPENPAYFAEYAQNFVLDRSALPPDFLETANRITPDNAFFTWFAAGQIGKASIEKKKSTSPSPPSRMVDGVRLRPLPRETDFDIKDPAVFEEAMALIAKAAAMPGFETYTNRMIVARVSLLPSGTMEEFTRALMYAYGGSTGMIQLRYAADLINARAEQLSRAGRKEINAITGVE